MKRILGTIALGLTLAVSGTALTPAAAASAATATVKGHATSERGEGLRNILVTVSSGAKVAKVKTTSTGYYAVTMRPGRTTIVFTDPAEAVVSATVHVTTKATKKYVVDGSLADGGTVTGTIRNNAGEPLTGVSVQATNAETGRFALSSVTNASGKFNVRPLPPGNYRIQLFAKNYFSEWYGEAESFDTAATFTVVAGQKTQAADAALTREATVSGAAIVDGKAVPKYLDERIMVSLINADGQQVGTVRTWKLWKFDDVRPGIYTLRFTPDALSTAFFTPTERVVSVGEDGDVTGLKERLVSAAASADSKRSVAIEATVSKRHVSKGTTFTVKAEVTSYGDPTGGTVSLTMRDKVLATKKIPASGKLTFTVTLPTLAKGTVWLHGEYSGTETTLADDAYLYYMRIK